MTANIFDISELFSDEVDNVTPIYFDLQSRRQFTHWLDRIEASALLVDSKTDKLKAFVKHLQQTRLPIVFFQGQKVSAKITKDHLLLFPGQIAFSN